MATASAVSSTQIFQEDEDEVTSKGNYNNNNINGVSRQDIQAAIAKTIELRALHAALLQGNSPKSATIAKFPSSVSPASHHSHHLSAQDYPIFTPVSPFFSFSLSFYFY